MLMSVKTSYVQLQSCFKFDEIIIGWSVFPTLRSMSFFRSVWPAVQQSAVTCGRLKTLACGGIKLDWRLLKCPARANMLYSLCVKYTKALLNRSTLYTLTHKVTGSFLLSHL